MSWPRTSVGAVASADVRHRVDSTRALHGRLDASLVELEAATDEALIALTCWAVEDTLDDY